MDATFFSTPRDFRTWLERHHRKASELLVGFHKVGSGTPSITWPEAVDQALCFGWIDGVRRRVDDDRYVIRFTPRKPVSTWSAVNLRRVAALRSAGLMKPAGLAAFERRTEKRSRTYSYERRDDAKLDAAHEKLVKSNRKAWEFFESLAPSYRRRFVHWVTSAKSEEVRMRRLRQVIVRLAQGRKV